MGGPGRAGKEFLLRIKPMEEIGPVAGSELHKITKEELPFLLRLLLLLCCYGHGRGSQLLKQRETNRNRVSIQYKRAGLRNPP